ncbi:MAG: cyclase family protein [Planctomycetales bacterium]|nr:cyclase family protein [Planctomycetales bacterium]
MRVVDLSVPLDNDRQWAPWWARNRVKRQNHAFGAKVIRWLLGLRPRHLKTGVGWANDVIKLSTHGTTHVDAPWHYGPECAGKPARTIDQMPLDWFHGPGLVLDIRELDRQQAASVDDLRRAADRIGVSIQPGNIVLIQTGNDRLLGSPAYFNSGPGVSAAATHWLLDQGVRVTGIDAWGWDRPLKAQAAEAIQSGRNDIFWEAHYVGVEREYCHMERLAQLDQLPTHGFQVCAFPLKVVGGSAGPARVVALVPDDEP